MRVVHEFPEVTSVKAQKELGRNDSALYITSPEAHRLSQARIFLDL